MKTQVWKFPLGIDDIAEVQMPVGAEVLYVDVQEDENTGVAGDGTRPYIWARVDPNAPMETRRFRFAGTGHPLEENVGKHLRSFQMLGGKLVWHLFELGE